MNKKKIITSLIGLSLLLLLLAPSTPFSPATINLSSKVEGSRVDFGSFTVSAVIDDIPQGTPIILKVTDFQLPYSMLQTAVVMDAAGTTTYPTQCDDLNGDNIVDEIVFLAPNLITIGNAEMFLLRGSTEGTSNGYSADAALKVSHEMNYNESYGDWLASTYSDTFMNNGSLSDMVNEVGEVVWADTNWGTFCLYVSAGWRQSSWKHIITKGANAVDLVMGDYNASDDWRWQWTKLGYADPGWQTGDYPDVVTIAEAGPIRIVIQTESGIGYAGNFGTADGLKARRTFILYKDAPGIIRNLQIIGENGIPAFESMTDYYGGPLLLTSKFVTHDQNTSTTPWTGNTGSIDYNTVYAPNNPGLADNSSRYLPDGDYRHFNLSEVTEPWFAMYNSGTENGFIVNWGNFDYLDQLISIDWSDGEIDVKYSFDHFPIEGLNQILMPVDGGEVSGTVTDYMKDLNDALTLEYFLTFNTKGIDEVPPMYSTYTNTFGVSLTASMIQVTADATSGVLLAGTPIVIKASDYPLPVSKLATAVVYDNIGNALTTQADDLDGDGYADEVVFLLPSDLDNDFTIFILTVKNSGYKNGYTANANLAVSADVYNETYGDWLPSSLSATFMNNGSLSDMVNEVGDVVWAETNWGIFCLYVSAGWRQSAWKHIVIKSSETDLVMADYNASDDWRWQWSKFGYADPGWQTGDYPDVVTIAKAGPIRIVIQTESGIGYAGNFGTADGIKASRTFTLYEDLPGIHRNLKLVGEDAETAIMEGMTSVYGGPLLLFSKFVPHDQNTSTTPWTGNTGSIDYNTVYAPNNPGLADNSSRYLPDGDYRHFNLSEVTAPWFGAYNSGTENGFIVNWGNFDYLDHLTSIDWSDGEFDVKYTFEYFPANGLDTVLIPVDGLEVTDTIEAYMANLNGNWTQEYLMDFTPLLKDPWITIEIVIETETVTETETETVTETETSVSVSISTLITTFVTTVTKSTPGFEFIFVLFISAIVLFRRRRK